MLDTTPERELPREAWRDIFAEMDATIESLVKLGVKRERACERIASYALARQSQAAVEAINAEGK